MATNAMVDMSTRKLYNTDEAAYVLGMSRKTFTRLVHSGRIQKVNVGRLLRFRASDLDTYIDSLTDDSTPIRKDNSS